jgi:hypothetical protein
MNSTKTCPDCKQGMKRIQIIDKVQLGHSYMEYTVGEADRNIWTAKFPVEGRIGAYMCDHCGRVVMYGEAKDG